MRINLVTPFAEKDQAKALGARWDSALKVWYIENAGDLTPFMRWIPDVTAAKASSVDGQKNSSPPVLTQSSVAVAFCGCNVPAWEDCIHTAVPTS